MASITQATNNVPGGTAGAELHKALASLLTDVTALRATLLATQADLATLRTAFNTAMTKLNADGGVTDTNYAAAAALTSAAPAALTTTS